MKRYTYVIVIDSTIRYIILQEKARVNSYLNPESEGKLLQVLEQELLEKREQELLDKEGSGCKVCMYINV